MTSENGWAGGRSTTEAAGPDDGVGVPEPRTAADGDPAPEHDDDGPLRGDVLGRIAGATTAILARTDRDGTQDISVLGGSRCFLRVLDRHRFAFPASGAGPTTAARATLAGTPAVAMLLLVGGTGRALHLNGTARVVPAAELRAQDPTVPERPIPGEATDAWVVVEVADLAPLDGDDVPTLGGARPAAPPPSPRPARRGRMLVTALVVLAVVAVAVIGVATAATRPAGPAAAAPPPPAVDPGPTGPPTLRGRVTDVRDPATVVVDVAGRPVTVGIVGLDAATIPACATEESLAFAHRTLDGQTVTLVPDPTLPTRPGVTRAYAVLGSQLSYTDAAIRAGHAPAAGPSQYRGVFDGEQSDAQDAGDGMWGPPCVR